MRIQLKRKYLIIIICLSYVLSLFIVIWLNHAVKTNSQSEGNKYRKMLPLKATPLFEKQFSFQPEDISTDGNNILILASPKNYIYIFDANGNRIYSVINKNDTTIRKEHIISFNADGKHINIADGQNHLVKSFDYNNRQLREVQIQHKIFRILFSSPGKIIIETSDVRNSINHLSVFRKIDINDQSEKNIKGIIPDATYNGLIYDGFFVPYSNGAFYINYFYNNIIALDTAGNVRFSAHTVDPAILPTVKVSDKGWVTYNGNVKIVNFGAAADGSSFYVLANMQQKMPGGLIGYYVDKYDTTTGAYMGSFLLPQIDAATPGRICFVQHKLYVLYKSKLICFQLKPIQWKN